MSGAKKLTVVAAQIAPVFMDCAATIEKACETLTEAAANGAKLIVFPEAFVPSYPDWVWVTPATLNACLPSILRKPR